MDVCESGESVVPLHVDHHHMIDGGSSEDYLFSIHIISCYASKYIRLNE